MQLCAKVSVLGSLAEFLCRIQLNLLCFSTWSPFSSRTHLFSQEAASFIPASTLEAWLSLRKVLLVLVRSCLRLPSTSEALVWDWELHFLNVQWCPGCFSLHIRIDHKAASFFDNFAQHVQTLIKPLLWDFCSLGSTKEEVGTVTKVLFHSVIGQSHLQATSSCWSFDLS